MPARFPRYKANKDRYLELKDVMSDYLHKYYRDCEDQKVLVAQDLRDILDAYLFKKPLTSLYFVNIRPQLFYAIIRSLQFFFFIRFSQPELSAPGCFDTKVFLSRFRNLVIATKYPFTQSPDILGVLLGYAPGAVAEYCRRWGTGLVKE